VFALDWRAQVERRVPDAVALLQAYCRQPSISAQQIGIRETIQFVSDMIAAAGGRVQVLDDCGGNPVIWAEFEPDAVGPATPTLLFYNHYDVQPPEPLEEWTSPPFAAEIRDGKLFARGAADNKADLVARLQAIQILRQHGGLPCRVRFLIEGEEEIGSPGLAPYLRKHAQRFRADACIWEFGGRDAQERVEMVTGVKGMCYLQLWATGADVDVHSSLGAVLDNPAWRLVQALASMRTVDNRIVVEGFYDGVVAPSEHLRRRVQSEPYDYEHARAVLGLRRPLVVPVEDAREALVFAPTMTLCGLESGYAGAGAKTVLPRRAQAKLDCRLVPEQDPADIERKIRAHLDRYGFTDVEVSSINGEKAYRANLDHPFVALCEETARAAYESPVVLWPNSAGTGPMHLFKEHLGEALPIVSTGCGWSQSRAHAPDESIRLADFARGIEHMIRLLERFGGIDRA
jgi:acetylornithine deacetylase/succinyl-diaminopimelate desuccinylase-like protein